MAGKYYLTLSGEAVKGHLISLTAQDLKDFLTWLRKDIAYKRKRSERHRQEAPESGDANAGAIAGRSRLATEVTDLLMEAGEYES